MKKCKNHSRVHYAEWEKIGWYNRECGNKAITFNYQPTIKERDEA